MDGKVYDTTFVSNKASRVAEELSRVAGLTIAKDVQKQKQHTNPYTDYKREQAKQYITHIAKLALRSNYGNMSGFLKTLRANGVEWEVARNKQGKAFGLRFQKNGQTFKASDIGREFGLFTLQNTFNKQQNGTTQQQAIYQKEHKEKAPSITISGSSGGVSGGGQSPFDRLEDLIKRKRKKKQGRNV